MSDSILLISPSTFKLLIWFALIAATLTPCILLGLLYRDKRKRKLW
jgi:hypothetical protein